MRVVIAPDKFAGTLTAAQAAAAMATGWRSARPKDDVIVVPMADGGAGTVEVIAAAVEGSRRVVTEVVNAWGIATDATWLLLPDGRAVVESAQACGLEALSEAQRKPGQTTSYGVGQLLLAATAAGAGEIIVGLGGTGTTDAGGGMVIALGHKLLRRDRNGVKVGAIHLGELDWVRPTTVALPPIIVGVDVDAPLLGPNGAVHHYGPQKGATDAELAELEGVVDRFATMVERSLPNGPWRDLPGAGAGGGLGFGLAAFCGATLRSGAALVGDLVGLPAALDGADLVITGEGTLDAQTAEGKAPAYVARAAAGAGAPAFAVVGTAAVGGGPLFAKIVELGPDGRNDATTLVTARTAELAAGVRA